MVCGAVCILPLGVLSNLKHVLVLHVGQCVSHPTWYVVPDIRWEPSIKDVRKGEGVCQKRTFADVGVGFGEMRI